MAINWDAVNAVAQSAGAIGVIVSLVYLAMQIREDARSRRAATVHEQVEAHASGLHTIATDGELAGIVTRGIFDLENLSLADRARYSAMLSYLFLHFEDSFFQHAEKHLDERIWHGMATPLHEMLAYPGVRAWWATRAHHYSADFRAYVEARIGEGKQPALYPERLAVNASPASR